MEQQIKDRYSPQVLLDAMRLYGITDDRIRPLHAFESFIYEFSSGTDSFILRLAHSLRRDKPLIYGEVDWINTLAERGVSVARAVPSPQGNLVEEVPDGRGGQFLVTAFVKALGRSPWDLGWTPYLYEAHGRLLGSMHVLARSYRPADLAWRLDRVTAVVGRLAHYPVAFQQWRAVPRDRICAVFQATYKHHAARP